MAQLEFKQRVKLPDEFFSNETPLERKPWPRWPGAALGWLAFVALCYGLGADKLPLGSWLEYAQRSQSERSERPTKNSYFSHGNIASPSEPTGAPLALAPLLKGELAADEASADWSGGASAQAGAVLPDEAIAHAAGGDLEASRSAFERAPSSESPGIAGQRAKAPGSGPGGDEGSGGEMSGARAQAGLSAAERAETSDVPSKRESGPTEPQEASRPKVTSSTSCEAAINNYQEEIKLSKGQGPADLTRSQFASILENGAYFSHCGVPASTAVDVCVAVQQGRAIGVTVRTQPRSGNAEACIARAARQLSFPSHHRMDVTRTHYPAN